MGSTRKPGETLWRFSAHSPENDRSETALILWAKDDGEAMRKGFAWLEEQELLQQKREAYHVPPADAEDDEGGFFSCEPIESESDLEAALDGIPAIGDLADFTGGIASITWPIIEGDR